LKVQHSAFVGHVLHVFVLTSNGATQSGGRVAPSKACHFTKHATHTTDTALEVSPALVASARSMDPAGSPATSRRSLGGRRSVEKPHALLRDLGVQGAPMRRKSVRASILELVSRTDIVRTASMLAGRGPIAPAGLPDRKPCAP